MPITTQRVKGNSATINVGDVAIDVTSDPAAGGRPIINIRSNSGPSVVSYGDMRSGVDPAAFARTPKVVEETPVAQPAPAPAPKRGFFASIGHALAAPFRWAEHLGQKSRFGAQVMGTGVGAAAAVTGLATGAVVANVVAPVAVHSALTSLGLISFTGFLGLGTAAILPAVAFGGLSIALFAGARAFFRGAHKPAAPAAASKA